jgi:pimeloyl-ACP methyl ester carboxylesterase
MLIEKTFDTGVVEINYVEGPPSGSPLVLLHGGGDRWQHFLPVIPSLVPRWHVYALDLRGHGKSGRVSRQYRPEHYVEDVVRFVKRQLAEPVVLLGHSLGGWVALMSAARLVEKVRGLILGDPPLNIAQFVSVESGEERVRMWKTLRDLAGSGMPVTELVSALANQLISVPGQDTPVRYGDLPGVNDPGLHSWAKTLSQVDPDVAMYHAEGRMDEYVEHIDLDKALQQVSCPVLLLQANPSHGGMISDSDVEHALSLLGNGLHAQLENAGHDLGLSLWEVVPLLRSMTNFLESI